MKKLLLGMLIGLVQVTPVIASEPAAVNPDTCSNVKNSRTPFMLVLKKGDNVFKAITQCAVQADLKGASFVGLGALDKVTLRYFDHKTKKYHDQYYPQFLELLSLNGNITLVNGKQTLHIHSVLSDNNFHVMGGDMSDATVAATAEIQIQPQHMLVKKFDQNIGLNLIQTEVNG